MGHWVQLAVTSTGADAGADHEPLAAEDECPLVLAKRREEGQIPDPKELPAERFREIRDLIESKVKELLASL